MRVSRRAKQMSLRILPPDGRVEVVLPRGWSSEGLDEVLLRHADWIAARQREVRLRHRDELAPKLPRRLHFPAVGFDAQVEYDDRPDATRFRIHQEEGRVVLTGPCADARGASLALQDFLKQQGRALLPPYAVALAERHGLIPGRIGVRLQRSRWGSCSCQGNISLNARLLLLPRALLDFVICHELAHLRFCGHGPDFRALLERMQPQRAELQRQLRAAERTLPAWVRARKDQN